MASFLAEFAAKNHGPYIVRRFDQGSHCRSYQEEACQVVASQAVAALEGGASPLPNEV